MRPPRYQDAPDEQSAPEVPYSQKKPERCTTAKQRAKAEGKPDNYEQGPAYFRRPVTLGFSNIKRRR